MVTSQNKKKQGTIKVVRPFRIFTMVNDERKGEIIEKGKSYTGDFSFCAEMVAAGKAEWAKDSKKDVDLAEKK